MARLALVVLCALAALQLAFAAESGRTRPFEEVLRHRNRLSTTSLSATPAQNAVVQQLPADTAGVRFINAANSWDLIATVLYNDDACKLNCETQTFISVLPPTVTTQYYQIGTAFAKRLTFARVNTGNNTFGALHHQFGEYGLYSVVLNETAPGVFTVQLFEDLAPDAFTFRPIWEAFAVLGSMGLVWVLLTRVYSSHQQRQTQVQQRSDIMDGYSSPLTQQPSLDADSLEEPNKVPKKKERVRSLDTFRGFALSIMIFVNYGGGGYWFFDHSAWNGITVADLVFPWFIFMMGASMSLSLESKAQDASTWSILYKIFRRSAILFGLGLIVSNGGSSFEDLRIPGVLQRFAVSYLVVALITTFMPKRQTDPYDAYRYAHDANAEGGEINMRDVTTHLWEWLLIIAIAVAHTLITFLLPVPGCPTGYLGPGGLADQGAHAQCVGGAVGYIDRQWLGINHIYQTPTCQDVYKCPAHDPEGILGCLTSICITFFGVQCGRIIGYHKNHSARIKRWLVWAVIYGSIALALCGAKQNGGFIPLNKNLWSLSFIFALAAMAHIALSICYIFVDVLKWWNGAPFIYPGMNSILVYFSSEMLQTAFPFTVSPASSSVHALTHSWVIGTNIGGVACFLLGAYYAHTVGFYLRI